MRFDEATLSFDCFGSTCAVSVMGHGAGAAAERARCLMLDWHGRFSRFLPSSELSRLNADERETVPVSPLMAELAEAAIGAAEATGGLVDPTLVGEIEAAGYSAHREPSDAATPVSLAALRGAAVARPAGPAGDARWRSIRVDRSCGTIARPLGVRLDSGGIAKVVFADRLARDLAKQIAFAVDCAGDLRLGGALRLLREVHVASPLDGAPLHTYKLARGAVATSGITRRAWVSDDGGPAHHLLDPSTGRPAYTGVIQVTAIAATGAQAEALAKAALLSGPEGAARWLPHGGVVVADDGSHTVVAPARRISSDRLTTFAPSA
jgi:thiamine biosynthesis lipoprotein